MNINIFKKKMDFEGVERGVGGKWTVQSDESGCRLLF